MNFKIKIFAIILIASIIVIAGCGSNSSWTGNDDEGSIKQVGSDLTTLNSGLHKNTKPLHSLPSSIIEFAQRNYPGYSIISAVSDSFCGEGNVIDIDITKTGAPDISLIFKSGGSFLQQEEDVSLSTVPNQVKKVLKSIYREYSAGKEIEKLILADKTEEYLFNLDRGDVSKEVIFKLNGDVVCEN
jgi:ABC-type cobalt transport system substrate-binding protein